MPRAPVLMLAGLFWLLVVLSAFWAEVNPVAFTAVCFFSLLPLTFFVGVMTGDESYFKKLIPWLAGIFGLLCVWAIIQFFLLNGYFQGQARHPLADPSSLGALFSLALFCALGWVLSDRPAKERKLATALAVLLTCGIFSTVARAPVFGFVPGIIFFCVLLWPKIKERRKEFLIIILAAVAFFALMQTGIQKKYDLGQRLFGTVAMTMENVGNNRIDIWSSAIDMIKDRPLLGTGMGTFFLYYPEYRRASEADGVFLAHNDPLQFWTELGVLGPLLFYAFVIAAAMRTFEALKKIKQPDENKIVIATIFSALVSMVAQSHVGFNHYNMTILLITGLLLAIWFLRTSRVLGENANPITMPANMPVAANKLFLALPFIMTGWLFMSIMGGEHFANRARDALFAQDMDAFQKNINMAGRVSFNLNYRTYLFAVNVPMTILDYRKDLLTDEQQRKLYDQITAYMGNVLAVNPRAATAFYYLAKVQGMVRPAIIPEGTTPPEEFYKMALAMDPLHLGSRLELFKIYKEQEKPMEDLIAFMEEGLSYTYTTPVVLDYYGALTNLYLEDKNYGKVQGVITRVAEFKKRSDFSQLRQNTSIPQAVLGGPDMFVAP